jgi:hypothetical protein
MDLCCHTALSAMAAGSPLLCFDAMCPTAGSRSGSVEDGHRHAIPQILDDADLSVECGHGGRLESKQPSASSPQTSSEMGKGGCAPA